MRAVYFVLVFVVIIEKSWGVVDADDDEINDYPIIGVVAQETYDPQIYSYIAASYVKFIEGGGARVIPVWINKPRKYYKHLMKRINGILFPGGAADLTSNTGYAQVGRYVYEIANEMNENGEYFPLWGTCLGFELMLRLGSNDAADILTPCKAEGIAQTLYMQNITSRLLGQASPAIQQILKTEKVAANFHHFCVTQEKFSLLGLASSWKVIATNKDLNGLEFIAATEHLKYPYYAVQFHPEKNIYEWWNSKAILHTRNAVRTSQYFAQFLVNEARKSSNSFSIVSEANRYLIYNWSPVFIGRNESSTLMQVYHFSNGEGNTHIGRMTVRSHDF